MTVPAAPMGERKDRPVYFPVGHVTQDRLRGVLEIPGVIPYNGGVRCTWDIAWAVARLLGFPEPEVPAWDGPMPGLERYRALGLHTKTWPKQKEGILFLARRAWALMCDVMRSGKCLMTIGADVLIGSTKTLIVCPAIARYVWADEIQQWTGESSLILSGRGGREARLRCLVCKGRAMLEDGTPCVACKLRNGQAYGYGLYEVSELVQVPYRDMTTGEVRWAEYGVASCPKHTDVQGKRRGRERLYCRRCHNALMQEIERARYVVINYELLVGQHQDLGGGRTMKRADLAGWVDVLKQFNWDVLIADEAHMLRGWSTAKARQGEKRNERLFELADKARRCWMVTGTPFYGFTKDVFWLLEIASGGLFGETRGLKGRKFMQRYCEGKKGTYGYEAKGRSVFAEVELMRRLEGTRDAEGNRRFDGIWVKRGREELFADAVPTRRRVVRLEIDGAPPFVPGRGKRRDEIVRAIRLVSEMKREAVMDSLMNELAEGNKIFILHFHKPSAKKTFIALEQAILGAKSPYRTRMKEVNAKAWLATGQDQADRHIDADADEHDPDVVVLTDEQKASWAESADARYTLARLYREHVGAGVIVATIDAMQVALSLKGCTFVHFLDLHYSPGAIAQAEERPWYPDIKGLSITYYSAKGTVDDHLEVETIPKIETVARMGREKGAQAMLDALGQQQEEERTFDRIWARLMKGRKDTSLDAT